MISPQTVTALEARNIITMTEVQVRMLICKDAAHGTTDTVELLAPTGIDPSSNRSVPSEQSQSNGGGRFLNGLIGN